VHALVLLKRALGTALLVYSTLQGNTLMLRSRAAGVHNWEHVQAGAYAWDTNSLSTLAI
jgi:hypothetical protein